MTPPPFTEPLDQLKRELERNAIRARNGIKYLAGTDWTTPSPTPKDTIWRQGGVELWRYRSDRITTGPPVLMFIGLVSRSSIFDLHEKASLVSALLEGGLDVYVLDWGVAGPGDADNTVETYVCRYLPRAVRAVLETSQASEVSLLGYCMGGNFALLAAAGLPDLPVRNVVTMATAIDFDGLPIQFEALRDPQTDISAFIDDETGCIPPDLVSASFRVRKPTAGVVQYANLLENLWNDAYVEGHQAIARWTSDHVPVPGAVARQAVDGWLQQNAFLNNTLTLDGKPVDLGSIRCPMLSILTLRDEIVPPAAAQPIRDVVGSEDHEVLELDAGHIGLVIGRTAYKQTYPKIVDWLTQHGDHQEA